MNSYQLALAEREKQHLLRSLPLPPEGIDFYSNDYLGLARSEEFSLAIEEEYARAPKTNGATGSRLLSGNSIYAEQVEKHVANYHNVESALIYASGYIANVGLISSLATKETSLICDELIHASLIDGARLGKSQRFIFKHNDPDDLEAKLSQIAGQKLVLVESVYSMDGDVAPLERFTKLCEKYDAMLVVDEAHGIGVFGKKGEGLVQAMGLEDKALARIMTYGKAPGIHGAAVVGPNWLRNYQINFSRSLIFSTAPSNHHLASIKALYAHLEKAFPQQDSLRTIIEYFVKKREQSDMHWLASPSQIQSLIVPGNEPVIKLAEKLKRAGINALPIRKPSVSEGAERIRFCLHSYNKKEEIDRLFDIL